jgi:hypothetical protein
MIDYDWLYKYVLLIVMLLISLGINVIPMRNAFSSAILLIIITLLMREISID